MSHQLKVIVIFMVTLLISCSSETKNKSLPQNSAPNTEEAAPSADKKGEIRNMTGTIVFHEIEGGFYGIEADDGKKYNPINLDESFRKDGLRVKFDANLKEGMVGIHMWGEYVEILKIEKIPANSPEEDK
jgi:hypothetical protein